MKLASLLIFVACMQSSAHSYSQTVNFIGKDVSLQTVFASIEKQTGVSFFFNYALIKDIKLVTLNIRDASLEDAIKEVLKGQDLDFYRKGRTIFIVKKQTAFEPLVPKTLDADGLTVKGRVINHIGESLVGATVALKNGRKSTLTNEKGEFELKNISAGSVLEISYLGYEKKSITVSGAEIPLVQLRLAESQLDVAQVIAYGQTTQRLSTGNITIIKGEDIEKQPVSDPLLALEGRVPGLYITQNTGLPGGGVTVRIQGQNSIYNGNDPLYVIDGVPYISELLSTGLGSQLGTSGSSTYGNPMNYINPADIESIEVLKDADATAIYGSRAANGAILVTTKKGKPGNMKVDLNLQNGWGRDIRRLPLLNTQEYLQMRHEALNNDGIPGPSPTDYDINGFWDTTRYTDWQKVLLGSTSQYTTLSGSVSGGNSNVQYLVGGTYHRETTVYPGSASDAKGSVHFNLNATSTNQRLKMQFTGSYMFDNNKMPSIDFTNQSLTLQPDAPALYKSDGTLNWQLTPSGGQTWTNPLANFYEPFQNKTYNLVSNAVLSYEVLHGLKIKSNFGYTNLHADEFLGYELPALPPPYQLLFGTNGRSANYGYNMINSWIIEPQIEYKNLIGYSKFEALLGSTITQNNSNGYTLNGSGYNSDDLLPDILSAATVRATSSTYAKYKYAAIFGRLNYSWHDKFLVNLVDRRDGSSRFGPGNQLHNFASAGIGWIFSEEGFFKQNLPVLSFGKLRGSYGTTGNDQIGDYKFMDLYTAVSVPVAYQGVTGLTATSLPNPYLQWEETKKLQGGIDLGFFGNRILLTANYVRNRSSNQLIGYGLPSITGFFSIEENLPATVQNTAGEFSLNTINVKGKNFGWTSSINLTIPKNKLISVSSELSSSYLVGKPVGVTRVFHFLGVDPATGEYYFSDSHGNATSTPDPTADVNDLVNSIFPTYYGGFQNGFRFKQFQLDILFQFVKHTAANYLFGASVPGNQYSNQPTYVLNRWQKSGDLTSTQRYNSDNSLYPQWADAIQSNAAYSDASFVRLKNLSLSYQAPERVSKYLHFQDLRIYIQGQNLATLTKFKGLDPESGNSSLPPLRVATVGIKVGL